MNGNMKKISRSARAIICLLVAILCSQGLFFHAVIAKLNQANQVHSEEVNEVLQRVDTLTAKINMILYPEEDVRY